MDEVYFLFKIIQLHLIMY